MMWCSCFTRSHLLQQGKPLTAKLGSRCYHYQQCLLLSSSINEFFLVDPCLTPQKIRSNATGKLESWRWCVKTTRKDPVPEFHVPSEVFLTWRHRSEEHVDRLFCLGTLNTMQVLSGTVHLMVTRWGVKDGVLDFVILWVYVIARLNIFCFPLNREILE